MKKILFICGNPPHPLHKKFAESVGADIHMIGANGTLDMIKKIKKIPRDYDVYFTEGLYNYLPLFKLLGKVKKNAKFINLFADPRLFQIIDNKKFDFERKCVTKYSKIRRALAINAIKKLAGAICVGKFQKDLLKKISNKISSEIVYVFAEKKGFDKLTPKLDKKNILFIGNGPDYYCKGLDLLIKSFLKLNISNKKLYVVGKDWDKYGQRFKDKGITFLGEKDSKEIKKYLKSCSLYCHFGRGDAFPVASLEAMLAGVPTMVSSCTGTKEIVEKVDKKFVVPLNVETISKRIEEYFKLPAKEKLKLGKRFRKQALLLEEKKCIKLFKEKFFKLLNGI